MIRKLITYPNPLLSQVSEDVTVFDKDLKQLVIDMFDTMRSGNGIGLSAVQVGVLKRVIVMEDPYTNKQHVIINPTITYEQSDPIFLYSEGCLSVPGYREDRYRPSGISVEHVDINGKPQKTHFANLEAFCFQHELDHLNGKLFTDELSSFKKSRIVSKVKKFIKNNTGIKAYGNR